MLASQGAQTFRRSRSTFRASEPCGFHRRREMVSTTICGELASWLSSVRVISESTGRVAIRCRGLCLSEIKSGHIRDAIRRGLGGKEYALPSLRCAIGSILVQSQVRARLIIVADVRFQNPAQMCLAQDNDVVQ